MFFIAGCKYDIFFKLRKFKKCHIYRLKILLDRLNMQQVKIFIGIVTIILKKIPIFNDPDESNILLLLQRKPLIVITLGQREIDNINKMITLTK